MTKRKKNARERRALVGALCTAAIIVAGSTFAWFSSKDEVTNRLSASADYNVAIAEDFTPPNNWVPGQKIDKNVGFVNTGNVDAFVRSYLQGEMRVIKETSNAIATWDTSGSNFKKDSTALVGDSSHNTSDRLTAVTDEILKGLNLNYKVTANSTDYYLRELKKTKRDNPNAETPDGSNLDEYSEVMSVQAGGELVYTSGTKFIYTPILCWINSLSY